MRQHVKRFVVAVGIAACCITVSTALAAELMSLRGSVGIEEEIAAPPIAPDVNDDQRQMRNYPEQPPVIPHAIDGYQLTLHTNQCLTCHARQFIEGSGAPMISVTHFMDREGQVLADVTPRRYFCNACHVPQSDVQPLVRNTFRDALAR